MENTYTLLGDDMTRKRLVFGLFLVVILFLLLGFYPKVSAITEDLPLLGRVIFVDPGHGGRDPGTMYGNIMEKDITLEISEKLRDQLSEKGAIVYMTRETDTDLSSEWDERKTRGSLPPYINV